MILMSMIEKFKGLLRPKMGSDAGDATDDEDGGEEFEGEEVYDDPEDCATTEEIETCNKTIKAWYDSGMPLFTKERLRAVREQKQAISGKSKGTFMLPDMYGRLTEHQFNLGCDLQPDGSDKVYWGDIGTWEYVSVRANVNYRGIQTFKAEDPVIRAHLYQNFFVEQTILRRDKKTKQMLESTESRSQEETKALLQKACKAWKSSRQCQQLVNILNLRCHIKASKIIAFGNGSMASVSPAGSDTDYALRSAYQHALLLHLKTFFDATECFAQDPIYKDADLAALYKHDISAVDDPEGFLYADESSAVISISPNIPVKQVLCDVARPAILIWARVEDDFSDDLTDPDSARVFNIMKEEYDCHEFPRGLDEHFGSYVAIYTKKCA